MRNFSRRGDAPTPFEAALVEQQDTSRLTDARHVWVDLAKTIGLHALFSLLDMIGGEKVHVPTREDLVSALWRQTRNAEIRAKLAAGASIAGVAAEYRITPRHVRTIRDGTDPDARAAEKW